MSVVFMGFFSSFFLQNSVNILKVWSNAFSILKVFISARGRNYQYYMKGYVRVAMFVKPVLIIKIIIS